MKRFFIWVCLLLAGNVTYSQESFTSQVLAAYLQGDVGKWEQLLSSQQQQTLTDERKFELLSAQYGLIGLYLDEEIQQGKKAEKLIESATEIAISLKEKSQYQASAYAILGALTGLKISISPWKGIYLGKKSNEYIDLGKEAGPVNPLVWMEKGNVAMYSPALFGGSIELAIKCYEKAISLFEADLPTHRKTWQYFHTMASLGQAYTALGKKEEAKQIYQKALELEPKFSLVKDRLLPALLKNGNETAN
ncbi:MAG: tetratricopeptide repeat protein [Bacteroidota bacterium]